jgi:putative transposase
MTEGYVKNTICWDNAPVESFFHTLKTELTHHEKYLRRGKKGYLRIISKPSIIGYKSTVEFEQEFQTTVYAI